MADEEQLKILQQGVAAWNEWREKNPELKVDIWGADLHGAKLNGVKLGRAHLFNVNLSGAHLSRADLRGANLKEADLHRANLSGADLNSANLSRANLSRADLSGAKLGRADISRANLRGADLRGAWLQEADFIEADLIEADFRGGDLRSAHLGGAWLREAHFEGANLSRADLRGANLRGAHLEGVPLWAALLSGAHFEGADLRGANLKLAQLIETDFRGAMLTGSSVYGASVWGVKVNEQTKQQNLIITDYPEPVITVDNLEVAQFIYLLLNNKKIRDVIDTITSKAVLILGRFSKERKVVLDALREELRKHDYLPILFDFTPSPNQATLGTIKTLASMARFVIADLTDARSVLMELGAVVPTFPLVAVRLMIKKSEHEYGMLDEIRSYRSVVEDTYQYEDTDKVIASIEANIIAPAEAKVEELRRLIRPVAR